MNHTVISSSRPNLPATTPAPPPQGKKTVYSTQIPPHFEKPTVSRPGSPAGSPGKAGSPDEPIQFLSQSRPFSRQKSSQEKSLGKIIAKYPYEIRESVNAVIANAYRNCDIYQKDLELSNHEISLLRTEMAKKTQQLTVIVKTCEINKSRVEELESIIETLQDNIVSRKKTSLRNKSAVTRLATTNRMLIDALDALQANSAAKGLLPTQPPTRAGIATTDSLSSVDSGSQAGSNPPRPGLLAPLNITKPPKVVDPHEYEESMQRMTMSQNDKLRESLLKIAREHYRSMKNAEHLELKLNEIKVQMKNQEQINRNLKSELDELKLIHNVDTTTQDDPMKVDGGKTRSFTFIDEKFQGLIERNLFDPMEGLEQLRGILTHMATAPNTLSLQEMILHVVSRESMKIFSADMICLYIVKPGQENLMHKFTARSNEAVAVVNMAQTKSLAAETLKSGKVTRMNALSKNAAYNSEVDGCVGINTKRILSLPLINTQHSLVIGTIQFINKRGNDVFTEVDEVFGSIYAYQISLLLTSCVMYDALFYHSQLLRGLLESSTDIFGILPDPLSLSGSKSLTVGDILSCLERVSRDLLKCPDAKAFLVSNYLNMPPDFMVMLSERGNTTRATSRRVGNGGSISSVPITSGIAGHVLTAKQSYLLEMGQGDFDSYLNPAIDLDPLNNSMLTVPILDFNGSVLGCLQLVVGSRSPRLKQSDDPHDIRLLFPQAASWLTHQIAPALRHLLSNIDRSVLRPASTPNRICRSSLEGHYRSSFFSNSEEVVNQMIQAAENVGGPGAGGLGSSSGDVYHPPGSRGREGRMTGMRNNSNQNMKGSNSFGNLSLGLGVEVMTIHEDESSTFSVDKPSIDSVTQAKLQERTAALEEKEKQLAVLQQQIEEKNIVITNQNKELAEWKAKQHDYHKKYQDYTKEKESTNQELAALKQQVIEEQEKYNSLEQEKLEFINQNQTYVQRIFELEAQIQASTAGKSVFEKELIAEQKILQQQIVEQKKREEGLVNEKSTLENTITKLTKEKNKQNDELSNLLKDKNGLQQVVGDMQKQVDGYIKKLNEKEKLQAILQEQIIKLANQSMHEISQQMLSPSAPAAALAPTASVSVAPEPVPVPEVAAAPAAVEAKNEALSSARSHRSEAKTSARSVINAQPAAPSTQNSVRVSEKLTIDTTPVPSTIAASAPSPIVTTPTPTAPAAVVVAESKKLTPLPSPKPTIETNNIITGPPPSSSKNSAASSPKGMSAAPPPSSNSLQQSMRLSPKPGASGNSTPIRPTAPPAASSLPGSTEKVSPAIATATTSDPAVVEWVEQMDDFGRKYYYNLISGVSAWEAPADGKFLAYDDYLASQQQQAAGGNPVVGGTGSAKSTNSNVPQPRVMRGNWLQHFDDYGQEYWVNQITGHSEWAIPADELAAINASADGIAVPGSSMEDGEDDIMNTRQAGGAPSIFDTVGSHYSASAGDYTIEL